MLVWLDFAIALLKMINGIINWAHDRGMIDEGRAQVIAEITANIAAKTQTRDKIREKVDAMDEKQVDEELAKLVRPAAGGPDKLHPS